MKRMSNRFLLSIVTAGVVTSVPCAAFADVVLNPNTITGQVRFSNTDPTVVALLQQLGMKSAYVVANSSSPPGYNSTTTTWIGNALARDFQISAESAVAGPTGLLYNIAGNANLYFATPGGYTAWGDYWFPTVNDVLLQPLAQQPAGASANIEECVGIVHVRWGKDASCDDPFPVEYGWIYTNRGLSQFTNTAEHWIIKQPNTDEVRDIGVMTGTDPGLNTFTVTTPLTLTAKCDEVQEICIDMSPYLDANPDLGSLTGPFDVLGEVETYPTYVKAWNGPSTNSRYKYFSPPEMPESLPATWWTLPNMVPGDYYLYGQAIFRTGRAATLVATPRMDANTPSGPITVLPSTSNDLQKDVGGQMRYPFVMTPAHFQGNVLLADPFVVANAGATSPLSSIMFYSDPPWNGVYQAFTRIVAYDMDTGHGTSLTGFDGNFDLTTGELAGNYDQVVVNPYDIPGHWKQYGMHLEIYDLATERQGAIDIKRDPTTYLMASGDSISIDHEYCFNEVTLSYTTTYGTLYQPLGNVTGGFSGTDWLGHSTQYDVSAYDYGWPNTAATAATSGVVHFSLPQGTYTIQPGASVISPSGAISSATFPTTIISVECGQRTIATPGLAISANTPACADSATPEITGTIASTGKDVERIWYQINGGPEIDICASNCGADPSFTLTPNLVSCGNTITIFALSEGQTTSVTTLTTFEDPSDGVDCAGECAPAPMPACAVVSAQPLACVGGDQGYEFTFEVTNNTQQTIAHVMMSDPHISPHTVTLPAPLAPGESTTVTVTVTNVNPGSALCVDVGMTDAAHDACCSQNVCFDIPACCFSVEQESSACVAGGAPGDFTYSFDFKNDTLESIEHVFLFPPPGITLSTDYVDVPTTPPGGIASVGPISIAGASPGQEVCVTVGIHDEAMNECCAEDVCVVAPEGCGQAALVADKSEETSACTVSNPGGSSTAGVWLSILGLLGLARGRRRSRAARL